jgi:hypothetical protein
MFCSNSMIYFTFKKNELKYHMHAKDSIKEKSYILYNTVSLTIYILFLNKMKYFSAN